MVEIDEQAREYGEHFDALVNEFLRFLYTHQAKGGENSDQLTRQEGKVLQTLAREEFLSMNDLAQRMMLAVSTMTGIIDKLVAGGFVRRNRSLNDMRVIQASLTQKGNDYVRGDQEEHRAFFRLMLECLTEEERDTHVQLMRKLASSMKTRSVRKEE